MFSLRKDGNVHYPVSKCKPCSLAAQKNWRLKNPDKYKALNKKKIAIIGVSCDDEKSHLKFIDKFELPFPLIADTNQKMVTQFGVWVEKSMYGRSYMGIARTTFIIDAKGNISHIIEKVDTKNHTAQILATLAQ